MIFKFGFASRYWGPPFLLCGLIFWLSGRSLPALGPDLPQADKIAHFCIYAILGALFFRALRATHPGAVECTCLGWSVMLAGLYGVATRFTSILFRGAVPTSWTGWPTWPAVSVGHCCGNGSCASVPKPIRRLTNPGGSDKKRRSRPNGRCWFYNRRHGGRKEKNGARQTDYRHQRQPPGISIR